MWMWPTVPLDELSRSNQSSTEVKAGLPRVVWKQWTGLQLQLFDSLSKIRANLQCHHFPSIRVALKMLGFTVLPSVLCAKCIAQGWALSLSLSSLLWFLSTAVESEDFTDSNWCQSWTHRWRKLFLTISLMALQAQLNIDTPSAALLGRPCSQYSAKKRSGYLLSKTCKCSGSEGEVKHLTWRSLCLMCLTKPCRNKSEWMSDAAAPVQVNYLGCCITSKNCLKAIVIIWVFCTSTAATTSSEVGRSTVTATSSAVWRLSSLGQQKHCLALNFKIKFGNVYKTVLYNLQKWVDSFLH